VLATLNLLAFAIHTACDLLETSWQAASLIAWTVRQNLTHRCRFGENRKRLLRAHCSHRILGVIRTVCCSNVGRFLIQLYLSAAKKQQSE
jgi:hypothetical protein